MTKPIEQPLLRWPDSGATRVPFGIYSDRETYEREQQAIFRGPTWSFLCLEADIPNKGDFVADLADISDSCRWTNGFWDFGPGQLRKWNELQNTTRDIQLLTNYLLFEYKDRVWRKPIPEEGA